jgi:hypothetical protein
MGWTWGRYDAPSDRDYDGQFDRFDAAGIERTCTSCGEPVMVRRDEDYTVHVCCDDCLAMMKRRQEIDTKAGAA